MFENNNVKQLLIVIPLLDFSEKSGMHLVKWLSPKLSEPGYLQKGLMDIHFLLMGSFLVQCTRSLSGIYVVALKKNKKNKKQQFGSFPALTSGSG